MIFIYFCSFLILDCVSFRVCCECSEHCFLFFLASFSYFQIIIWMQADCNFLVIFHLSVSIFDQWRLAFSGSSLRRSGLLQDSHTSVQDSHTSAPSQPQIISKCGADCCGSQYVILTNGAFAKGGKTDLYECFNERMNERLMNEYVHAFEIIAYEYEYVY